MQVSEKRGEGVVQRLHPLVAVPGAAVAQVAGTRGSRCCGRYPRPVACTAALLDLGLTPLSALLLGMKNSVQKRDGIRE